MALRALRGVVRDEADLWIRVSSLMTNLWGNTVEGCIMETEENYANEIRQSKKEKKDRKKKRKTIWSEGESRVRNLFQCRVKGSRILFETRKSTEPALFSFIAFPFFVPLGFLTGARNGGRKKRKRNTLGISASEQAQRWKFTRAEPQKMKERLYFSSTSSSLLLLHFLLALLSSLLPALFFL